MAIAFALRGSALTASVDRNTILIAFGTLCLGFGSASVVYQYYRSRQDTVLKTRYDSLRARADTLVQEFKTYKNKSNAMTRGR